MSDLWVRVGVVVILAWLIMEDRKSSVTEDGHGQN